MDIVNRLKFFMDSLKIGNSQFADNCRIPRPTLSQLLNGRNKKISDEIIAKIHSAYPQLSVLWLMFGEGGMLNGENLQISEPKKAPTQPNTIRFDEDNQGITTLDELQQESDEFVTEKLAGNNPDVVNGMSGVNAKKGHENQNPQHDSAGSNPLMSSFDPNQLATLNTNPSKKIANIVVFYTDNSFQSFSPTE